MQHRRPPIRFSDAPRGSCRWCGEAILHPDGPKSGQVDYRRRWHPKCVAEYESTDPRELRRRVRKRDRGVCRDCGLDTQALKRRIRGRGRTARLRELGFQPRRSLWELDHVVPLIDGGGHELSNLQTLCAPCHRKKSAEETRDRARRRTKPSVACESSEPAADSRASGSRERAGREEDALEKLLAHADEANARVEALLEESR